MVIPVPTGLRLCLLLLSACSGGVAARFRLHRRESTEQEIWQFKQEFGDDSEQEQWFEQRVDHFDHGSNSTWKQRYWRAEKYGQTSGPQFLCIGGEGEAVPSACGGAISRYARELNATIWTVEHRFYGRSQPFGDFSTEHLRYLTSEQAVEDLANFIGTQNSAYNISNPQWVLFGGSYSGSLALWTRQLHPELTVGAVGSSAPMEPLVDFYQYMQVVEDALRTFDHECPDRVKNAISRLSVLLKSEEGRAELDQTFNLSLVNVSLSYSQMHSLFSDVINSFNVQDLGLAEAKRVCDASQAQDPIVGLRGIVGHLSTDEYEEMLSWLTNASSEGRAWIWQTCNEFGWFQSTDLGGGIFGEILPVNWYINRCTDVFGPEFNITYIEEAVRRTLRKYGGRDRYNGSNVVIPNGSLDPWHAMGFYGPYRPLDPSAVVLFINGTTHCDDQDDSELPQVKEAQNIIFANVKKWLGHEIVEGGLTGQNSNDIRIVVTTPISLSTSNTVEPKLRKPISKLAAIAFDDKHRDAYLQDGTLTTEEMAMVKEYGDLHGIGLFSKAHRRHGAGPPDINVTEGWITQDLDHFNSSNFDIWKQRFFYTEKFYEPGGPVFLIIAGEWEESAAGLAGRYPTYLEYAESHHAAVYLLEHRYYGHSIPPVAEYVRCDIGALDAVLSPNATDTYYRYLSSEQALADAAQFVETINRYKGHENPKWVSFGFSYAGVLSAWFRQAYPSLVVGAVASSAPVQAKVDFYESYQVVQANLELYGNCESNVRTAVREVYELAQTEAGRAKLNQTFGRVQSAYGIPGIFLAGYGDNGYYKRACLTMNNSSRTPLQNLAGLLNHKSSLDAVSYDNNLHQLLWGEKRWDREVVRMRAWAYQTCTEFGFFFSTDYGNGTFASLVPVNGKVETCIELYGAVQDRRRVDEAVARTNIIHGGATNYNGTNVVYFNGGADLWFPLSVLTNRSSSVDGSPEVTSFLVPEQPHGQDMYKDPNDPPQLIEARKRTNQLIGEWIR